MVKGGYLRSALAAERGVDFKKVKQARKRKAAEKSKRKLEKKDDEWEDEEEGSDEEEEEDSDANGVSGLVDDEAEESDDDEEDSDEEEGAGLDIEAFDDSDSSESEIEIEEKIERPKKAAAPSKEAKKSKKSKQDAQKKEKAAESIDEDEDEEEEDEEEDVAWSDLEDLADEEREDLIPHQKQTINNQTALLAAAARIEIPTDSSVTFASHQTVSGKGANTEEAIPDISDDLTRELEFLRQSLEATKKARSLLLAEKVPFSRPNDYFAEMVKPDELMEKVKAKLIEDATAKKAAAEARKQRDLKKFGKQVQVAKLQERAKAKKETLEKIKTLKRKRQENSGDLGETEGNLFDVAVDDEIKRHNSRSEGGRGGRGGASAGRPNAKRQKKNEKYGFGGKKRHAKSGDAISSGDMREFSVKRMKGGSSGGRGGRGGRGGSRGGASRPGKSRRQAMANRG